MLLVSTPTSIFLEDVSIPRQFDGLFGSRDLPIAILPGTVNDATTFPPPSKSHGSHHWAFERLLSAALIPLTASTFALSASPYPVLDGLLAVSLVIHSHIGFDSMLVDYVHDRKFPVLGPVAKWGLRTVTLSVLVGVYQFNTTVSWSEYILSPRVC